MSEHQHVAFRAIERPVSETNLAYMRRQSSRAKITPWSFENEYHFGDFHGNALEMLRRGYDIHLHYANYGVRVLLIRLPRGLPDAEEAKPYFLPQSLNFLQDESGGGGTLCIRSGHEPGDLEDLWEIGTLVDRLVPLRAEILDRDLRPLYLAHLAVSCDSEHNTEETREAPVPAGLDRLSDAQQALAKFYGLSDALIAATASESPPIPARVDPASAQAKWIRRQSESRKHEWLVRLLTDANSTVRADMLAEFRSAHDSPSWPTAKPNRTIAQLQAAAEEVARQADRKAAANAARRRAKRLADMAADPASYLREAEQLVAQRTLRTYHQAGELLAELREALAGGDRSGLAEKHALQLKKKNPTLRGLTGELRRHGLI